MRDGPPVKPARWWSILDVVWRKRKAVFYAISAISFALNGVALGDLLHVRASTSRLLLHLLPHARYLGSLLQQRSVLYMLLNLIMLRILLKSGLLAGLASKRPHHDHEKIMQEGGIEEVWSKDSSAAHLPPESKVDGGEQERVTLPTFITKKKGSSVDLMAWRSKLPSKRRNEAPSSTTSSSATPECATGDQDTRQASLFTIEPLREPAPSSSSINQPASPLSLYEVPQVSNDADGGGVDPVAAHWYNHGLLKDYELNGQEFNDRVESFITKFKRNLTMQRQDSLNCLLGLVGARDSKHTS